MRGTTTPAVQKPANGRVSGDRANRLRALDRRQSFIVQAPAGSGKTELLIQRFLGLLGSVELPESIIALTFTRKAAAEMRHRVIGALEEASGEEPAGGHERDTWRLARAALARDDARGWQLLRYPARLRIQTIDSLCASIVRQMPWVSRMGAAADPDANIGYLYRRAARRTLESGTRGEATRSSVGRVLAHLDNNLAVAEFLIAGMLQRRDQWLRHVVGTEDSASLRRKFEVVIQQIIGDALRGIEDLFPDRELVPTLECVRFAAENLVSAGTQSPLTSCADLEGLPDEDARGLPAWLGLGELFLTRDGRPRKAVNVRQGFPPTPEGKAFKERLAGIDLPPELVTRLHDLRTLPSAAHTDSEWKTLESLLELLPKAVAELKLVFRAEGRVDFTEVSQAARTALGSPASPTGLAFTMDCRIQHLLVDEFQDTSQSQFDLLQSLTADWQPGDGRTLFAVGDPMQSIYGFREADVGLFLRARQQGLGTIVLNSVTLSTNFRSTEQVVNWINNAVGPAFPSTEDLLTGAVRYEKSRAHPGGRMSSEDSSVSVHPFSRDEVQGEAERILEIVRSTRELDPEGSIAVLVRAREHLVHTLAALRQEGVPFEAVEIDALRTRSVVQDLLALTRALTDPADRVSWLAILRAPWCGLTLADLDGLVAGDMTSSVWDLLLARIHESDHAASGLSADGRVRLERVHRILGEALSGRGTTGLRRWIEGVWLALGGPACLNSPADIEDALTYLDLVSAAAPGAHIRDEERFVDGVGRLFAEPDTRQSSDEGVLQLLTIHKAKGLEFDTVILPGLGRVTRSGASPLMRWLEYLDSSGSTRLLLAPIREAGTDDDPISNYLGRVESSRNRNESTRLLYVATTRARKRLHLMGHVRVEPEDTNEWSIAPPDPRTLLSRIWPAVHADFAEAFERVEPPADPEHSGSSVLTTGAPLVRLPLYWETPEPPGAVAWSASDLVVSKEEVVARHPSFQWASDLQRRVGIVVHRVLQHSLPGGMSDPASLDQGIIRAALASEGVGGPKLDEATMRVTEAIRTAMADERGRWILAPHEDDHREYPLSSVLSGRVRRYVLDRTFVQDGVRWIIDYKTSAHEGAGVQAFLDNEQVRYRPQLEEYARAMHVVDSRPIRLGLYFPLLAGWREWSFEPTLTVQV